MLRSVMVMQEETETVRVAVCDTNGYTTLDTQVKPCMVDSYKALFHEWTRSLHAPLNAIVELPDGTVRLVPYQLIRFVPKLS